MYKLAQQKKEILQKNTCILLQSLVLLLKVSQQQQRDLKKAAEKIQIANANVFKCPSDMTWFDF